MKTNKILVASLVTIIILSLGIGFTYSYLGNGQGQGISQGYGKSQNQLGKYTPGDIISNIPSSDLTDQEIAVLKYGYSEEMVARDAYNYLYELYGEEVFNKIASSEQQHMDAVKVLLDRYNIEVPTGYGDLQSTFDELKAYGEIGLKEALEVGIQIEILDIKDIENTIKNTDNEDFKVVFTKIGGASYNHLRSFLRTLDNYNFKTNIDYSEFMSAEDVNTRGPLQYKLAERLENSGEILPNIVSSEEMKNMHGNNNTKKSQYKLGYRYR